MEEYVQRLIAEEKELREKIDKLYKFIHSEKFEDVDDVEQSLMSDQLEIMMRYRRFLVARIRLKIS